MSVTGSAPSVGNLGDSERAELEYLRELVAAMNLSSGDDVASERGSFWD